MLCLDLLVTDDLEAVICEHHEDFLLKMKSGMFIGVQIRTQLTARGPFKTNDEPVVSALNRFVSLEIEFPDRFEAFILVANCDFYGAQDTETNLRFVIEKLKANPQAVFSGTSKTLIDDLHEANNCTKKKVRETLAKVRLDGNSPKFEDITGILAIKIGKLRQGILSFRDVLECANSLLNRVLQSSALPCDQVLRSHLVLSSSPAGAAIQMIVEHKRITQDVLSNILTVSSQPFLIPSAGNMVPVTFPVGSHRLEKKMATGGISAPSIATAKDLQASAEHVLQEWIARYGGELATKRRAHIDLAVRTQCAEAFDEAYSQSTPFGAAMLGKVRQRIHDLAIDKQHVLGLKYEQLLGFVSLATQECRVWWSDFFEISEASDASL
jgi:hypothetical protein